MSPDALVNFVLSYATFFPISTSIWFTEHIISHHPFTNMVGYDPDMGRPDAHEKIKYVIHLLRNATHFHLRNRKAVYTPKWVVIMWAFAITLLGFFLNIEAYLTKVSYLSLQTEKHKTPTHEV